MAALLPAVSPGDGAPVRVIVRAREGAQLEAAHAVQRVGGTIGNALGLINGFVATMPSAALRAVRRLPEVLSATPDSTVRLLHSVDGFEAGTDAGSLHSTTKSIRAHDVWKQGYTGRGIDVALIDSGVAPVEGLTDAGKIVNGPDISFDSQRDNLRHMDLFGHGTHMAGIIAGRDTGLSSSSDLTNHDSFVGIAPNARVVSVKVANAVGATDVSQIIAALDWVVQNRNADGMNIRVINLSFGTDSTQSYLTDPLMYAAEVAWRRGIVVVVAAGNDGETRTGLRSPARDPHLLAVGASDGQGTFTVNDDSIPSWSSVGGPGLRGPDLVAPGRSIASLRNPGSFVDDNFPDGRINERFFRGSGTSQAAAVISGAAAVLLQQRPSLTPDQVKRLLTSTASSIPDVAATQQGAGVVNLLNAINAPTPATTQTFETSSGTGSLEAARGSYHVVAPDGTQLTGEQDIFGQAWTPESSSSLVWTPGTSWSGTSWSGGQWNGSQWTGGCWCGTSWSGTSWSGTSWSDAMWAPGTSWSSSAWSDANWSGTSWSGTSWSGTSWSGTSWSGTSWSGTSWSGTSWSGTSWSGTSWSGTSWSGTSWSSDQWSNAGWR